MKYKITNEQLRRIVEDFIRKQNFDRVVSVDVMIDTESYAEPSLVVQILLFDDFVQTGVMRAYKRHNISEKVGKKIATALTNFFGHELADHTYIQHFWTKEKNPQGLNEP